MILPSVCFTNMKNEEEALGKDGRILGLNDAGSLRYCIDF